MINIYYLSYCPHSANSLQTLKQNGIPYNGFESDNIKEMTVKRHSKSTNDHKTFPQLFWGKNFIGGNAEFQLIISCLKNNTVPKQPKNWNNKKWLDFLTYLAENLKPGNS